MKLNRKIWLCIFSCFQVIRIFGQFETGQDSLAYETLEDPVVYDTAPVTPQFDPVYHFDDSAQSSYNRSESRPEFNRDYWKQLVKDMNFEEEKSRPRDSTKMKKEKKKGSSGSMGALKYVWIVLTIAILLFVLYKFLPAITQRNIRNKKDLIINLDELDEEEIKSIELETPLSQALRDGDHRTAYRLRYLSVLKQLIRRNLILYKKEKTNYEYLLQLSGKPVYEPFRLLTFNFDGIWYGDLAIDKARYEELDQHFVNFNRLIGQ